MPCFDWGCASRGRRLLGAKRWCWLEPQGLQAAHGLLSHCETTTKAAWRVQELIVDPKSFSTPANLEAAPGSQPNPLLAPGSAASSSSSMSAATGAADGGGGSAAGSAPGSARAAAAAAAEAELQRLALSQDDHPLSTSSSSKWQSYFKVCWGGRASAYGCTELLDADICSHSCLLNILPQHACIPRLAGRGGAGAD